MRRFDLGLPLNQADHGLADRQLCLISQKLQVHLRLLRFELRPQIIGLGRAVLERQRQAEPHRLLGKSGFDHLAQR